MCERCLLSACFWCVCLCLTAQAQYRFDSWTTDNGLPQASVNSILQTRDGYIWLATFGGLVRFDGLRFQVFNTGNTKGLRSGRFMWLYEDRAGNLWINTEAHGLTRYKDDVFTTYTTENGLPSNQVWHMYEDSAGNLKAQTVGGLTQWAGGSFKPFTPGPDDPPPTARVFQRSSSGNLCFAVGGVLRRFEAGRGTFDLNTGHSVNNCYEDREGRLWLSTREERLLLYQDGKLKIFSEKESYRRFPHVNFLEDGKGSLWMGTGDEGLIQLKDGKFTRYTTADGLAGNGITSMYQDREGTLWIGSPTGLSRMTERVVTTYTTKDGLASDNVYPIYEDRHGQIWIGSHGLTRYSNGVFTNVSREYGLPEGSAAPWVTSLLEDSVGGLWIGNWAWSIRYVRDGKVIKVEPDGRLGMVVHVMIQDRAGNVWIGSSERLIQSKDGRFTSYTIKDGLNGQDISALYEDRLDQLWIGTDLGLTKYKDGKFTAYTQGGAPSNIVRSIYEDAEDVLWIGTYDTGLYRLKDGRFTHYTTNEGLFDNGVFSTIEDGSGNFWISCNLGIYRVRKAELNDLAEGRTKKITSVPYGKRDGMLDAECNGGGQPAGIRARDGRLWFPTQQGVAVIDPARVPVNTQPPPVLIESTIIDNKPVDLRGGLRLQPDQVNLEINYTGLSFISPELVKFKYKLEGLDPDWVDAGTRRTAYYAHLPPGSYSFRVIAANRDGIWNQEGATLRIAVVPPFWRTRLFMTGAIMAVGLFAFVLYQRRIAQFKRAHRAQEIFSQQLIDSQEGERKRIAAELHDSLGQSLLLIKNRAVLSQRFLDDPVKAREQIAQIEGAATESIKEVRQIAYDLRPYQLDQIGLTQALEELVERVSGSGPIKFTASIAKVDDLFSVDAAINVYRILQEALNNIVKHSGAGEASVTVTRDEREVLMEIRDNGKGFAVEATDGKWKARRGFGLTGLDERARMLGGKLSVVSTPGQGTTVSLILRRKE
ncbi:MAG TPA: two-component regulator propeller domain-containing protein [Pyrinomonadaceae bacterium]|nr:two-component regulator propeller domain-containing protein [Pyrinomonadaceae bacterium]